MVVNRPGLLTDDLFEFSVENPCNMSKPPIGFSSKTQAGVVTATRSGNLVQATDEVETHASRAGMAVSHPHLDRQLIEFVASIPVSVRPADGRSKTIVRNAYRGFLPDSVLDRKTSTYADDYMVDLLLKLAAAFIDRFPSVTESAAPFIDRDAYARHIEQLGTNRPDYQAFRRIWPTWTLMMWLDTMHRYGQ
jgi:asparagine synthase (glutamine-hydrolysing)